MLLSRVASVDNNRIWIISCLMVYVYEQIAPVSTKIRIGSVLLTGLITVKQESDKLLINDIL